MEQTKIGALLGSNIVGAALHPLVSEVGQLLVMAGQIAVAIVTVCYIVKKIKALKNRPPKD